MKPFPVILPYPRPKVPGTYYNVRPLKIAALSIHSSPLGELGTEDTGGMSVYIRELSLELGRAGHSVDIYTCADSGGRASRLFLSDNVRLIHLGIGQKGHITKSMLSGHLPEVFHSLRHTLPVTTYVMTLSTATIGCQAKWGGLPRTGGICLMS